MADKEHRPLRKAVDAHCRSCIYNESAPGTWREQVTLCSFTDCELHFVRPVSHTSLSELVLDYYHMVGVERALYARSQALYKRFESLRKGVKHRRLCRDRQALEHIHPEESGEISERALARTGPKSFDKPDHRRGSA